MESGVGARQCFVPPEVSISALGNSMFLTGEIKRTIDERHRLTLPQDFAEAVSTQEGALVVAKERSGCLSLWPTGRMEKAIRKRRQSAETED